MQLIKTFWSSLPNEVILKIFSFLEITVLAKVANVCKEWNETSKSDLLWKNAALIAKISAKENLKDSIYKEVVRLREVIQRVITPESTWDPISQLYIANLEPYQEQGRAEDILYDLKLLKKREEDIEIVSVYFSSN